MEPCVILAESAFSQPLVSMSEIRSPISRSDKPKKLVVLEMQGKVHDPVIGTFYIQ